MTVQELLSRVSSREISEWQAFFRIENEELEGERLAGEARAGAKSRMRR